MHPRRTVPLPAAPWAALVLVLLVQCDGRVISDIPGQPDPGMSNPGSASPSSPTPPLTPPGMAPPGSTPEGPTTPPSVPTPPTTPPGPATPPGPGTPPSSVPTPVGPPGPWARGVQVGLVEAAQGVFVKLGDAAGAVAPATRNAPLIEGRPLFARVHVTTEAGFTARSLRAVLSLTYGDQSKFEIEDSKMIAGSTNVQQLPTSFNFLVPAERVKPNTTFSAAVYETGAAMGPDPATLPRFPGTGTQDLGIKAGKMELTIVIVPAAGIMDSPERRTKLEKDVYDLYPVQKVNLRFHEPVPTEGAFTSTQGFAILRMLREQENAKPWEYYHYVTTGPASFAGVSSVANATPGAAARRTSITIVSRNNPGIDGNTNTVAHETGHASGSSHMPGCGAAGPDAMYPYRMPAGDAGVNGYSLSFNAFKSRMMFRDLMSYCRPRWISDYVWSKFEARVRIVTGFENAPEAMVQMMSNRSLLGYAGPGQKADWGIVAGQLVDQTATITPTQYARLRLVDGREVMAPVAVSLLSDDETREFAVNLDDADYSDADILQAEVVIDGERSMVPVGSLYRR